MDKRTVTLLATVLALCANAAWASFVGDGNATAVAAERAKTSAEKGDAVAQFRYAEMLRDGCGVAKNMREAVTRTHNASGKFLARLVAGDEVRGCVRRYDT